MTLKDIIERLDKEACRLDKDGIDCLGREQKHAAYANIDMARSLRIAARWLESPDAEFIKSTEVKT